MSLFCPKAYCSGLKRFEMKAMKDEAETQTSTCERCFASWELEMERLSEGLSQNCIPIFSGSPWRRTGSNYYPLQRGTVSSRHFPLCGR
jgi:hypothetical protein